MALRGESVWELERAERGMTRGICSNLKKFLFAWRGGFGRLSGSCVSFCEEDFMAEDREAWVRTSCTRIYSRMFS